MKMQKEKTVSLDNEASRLIKEKFLFDEVDRLLAGILRNLRLWENNLCYMSFPHEK